MAEAPTDSPSPGAAVAEPSTAEETAAPAAAPDAPTQSAPAGGAEGEAPVAAEAAASGETAKSKERRTSRRKTSLKKKEDEEDEEEVEVPKIIYSIDSKIQETLRKAWTLFIKKGQKKKTEIAELRVPYSLFFLVWLSF